MFSKLGSFGGSALNQRRIWGISGGHLLLVTILAVLSAGGCSETRVPVFPVSGKVSFQGKPPVGALVVLNRVGSAENPDFLPTGTVKEDGSFTITAYEPGDGAPQGEYVATIQWYKIDKELGGPGPNVLPKKFASAKESPVKVSVGNGPVEIPPISIR